MVRSFLSPCHVFESSLFYDLSGQSVYLKTITRDAIDIIHIESIRNNEGN